MKNSDLHCAILKTLNQHYPDTFFTGQELEFNQVDFFMEQEILANTDDVTSSTRRVIAILPAEWAKVTRNFNLRVSNAWFDWHQRVNKEKLSLGAGDPIEADRSAKKTVKAELQLEYGLKNYSIANNNNAFLVEGADWNFLDTLAKHISDRFSVKPADLTIIMAVDNRVQAPDPESQGLCRYGHELRFCRVTDLAMSLENYVFNKDLTKSRNVRIQSTKSKPSLKELLMAGTEKVVVGNENSKFPERSKAQILAAPDPMKRITLDAMKLRVVTWNIQLGSRGEYWDSSEINKVIQQHDVCFFQEVPILLKFDNINEFVSFDAQTPIDKNYRNVTLVRKSIGYIFEETPLYVCQARGRRFAQILKMRDNRCLVNVHLSADSEIKNAAAREHEMKMVKAKLGDMKIEWIGGDFNCENGEVEALSKIINIEIISNNSRFSCDYWYDKGNPVWKLLDYLGVGKNDHVATNAFTMFNNPQRKMGMPPGTRHWPVSTLNTENFEIVIDGVTHTAQLKSGFRSSSIYPALASGGNSIWRPDTELGYKVGKLGKKIIERYWLRTNGEVVSKDQSSVCGSWTRFGV